MNRKSGFTLIELIITIAVIAILAGALMVLINPAKILGNARNAGRASDLRQLADALDRYYAKNGVYPVTGGWCGGPGSNWVGTCVGGGEIWIPDLVLSGEVKKLPKDPRHGEVYPPCVNASNVSYLYYSDGTDYKILDHCGPENISPTDKMLDPVRPTFSWAVWSSDVSKMW